jgi:predicted enzyme related to lactoylglutathione lyase
MTFQVDGRPLGMLASGDHNQPSESGPLVYFASPDDIDDCLKRVEAAGGKVLMPKTPIGPYGFIAFFRDTEGNRLALHSM